MYKCTECNTEFDKKPDYCDCGNDTFEEIITDTPVAVNSDKKNTLSIAFFVLCLILSFLVWLFLGNTAPKKQENTEPKASKPIKSETKMPDISAIWDDTHPSQIQKQETVEPIKKKIEQDVTTPVQKPAQTTKPTAATKNPAPKQNKAQPQTQKPKTSAQPKTSPQKPKANNQEMISYKTALRQALFSHLAITSIHGKGSCSIEFSIAQNGRLTGRRFIKQSQNSTVNDAVYNMLMSVPQYYPPPDSYKGEKIKMSFYFDEGYYEINYFN